MTSRVLVGGKEGRRLGWWITRNEEDAAGPATMTSRGWGEGEKRRM